MSTGAPTPTSWWPLTRKIRGVVAAALAGDVALVIAELTHTITWTAVLVGVLTSTSAAIVGYLTSDAPAAP